MNSLTVEIRSLRNTVIPAMVFPSEKKTGLVMLAHSFKSDYEENGRFTRVAEELSKAGISTIMMDFPGNGRSKEPLMNLSLDSCLDDMESCLDYMLDNYDIDRERMGMLGYSLGGRVISLFTKRHPDFRSLVYWAGCNQPFTENDSFLQQKFSDLKGQCDEKGYCDFWDVYEEKSEKLSGEFIDNMLEYDPLKALGDFEGNALVIQGDQDSTIDVSNGKWTYDALSRATRRQLLMLEGADHLFGLYDGREQDSDFIVKASSDFLIETLSKEK